MKLVVDTNIFFASLFNLWGKNTFLLLHAEDYGIQLVAPYFLFDEIQKHITRQARKKWYIPEKLMEYVAILTAKIQIYDDSVYQNVVWDITIQMKEIDPQDMDFVALAFFLKIPLRTNDKKLKEKIHFIEVIDTTDILQQLEI